MSGPIVRKYGFPNFENIFGKRELEHGVDDEATRAPDAAPPSSQPEASNAERPTKAKPGSKAGGTSRKPKK